MAITDHNAYSERAYGTCHQQDHDDHVIVGYHRSHKNCATWMAALFWIFFAIVFMILIVSVAGCGNN